MGVCRHTGEDMHTIVTQKDLESGLRLFEVAAPRESVPANVRRKWR